jgi:hypothetical protein
VWPTNPLLRTSGRPIAHCLGISNQIVPDFRQLDELLPGRLEGKNYQVCVEAAMVDPVIPSSIRSLVSAEMRSKTHTAIIQQVIR